jgi:hypothetical protein
VNQQSAGAVAVECVAAIFLLWLGFIIWDVIMRKDEPGDE